MACLAIDQVCQAWLQSADIAVPSPLARPSAAAGACPHISLPCVARPPTTPKGEAQHAALWGQGRTGAQAQRQRGATSGDRKCGLRDLIPPLPALHPKPKAPPLPTDPVLTRLGLPPPSLSQGSLSSEDCQPGTSLSYRKPGFELVRPASLLLAPTSR
eukprot:364615-Chlamydomonas_euryale.AAC.50